MALVSHLRIYETQMLDICENELTTIRIDSGWVAPILVVFPTLRPGFNIAYSPWTVYLWLDSGVGQE